MTIGVCKDCKERHTACWGTCERYLAARKELEAKKAAAEKYRNRLKPSQITAGTFPSMVAVFRGGKE